MGVTNAVSEVAATTSATAPFAESVCVRIPQQRQRQPRPPRRLSPLNQYRHSKHWLPLPGLTFPHFRKFCTIQTRPHYPAPLPGPEETEAENSTTTVPAVVDTPNGPTTVLVHCDPLPASGFTPSTPLVIGDKVLIAGKVETVSETGPAPRKRATRVILPTTSPIHFDADEVVRLYEAGHKVVDIAVAMGYPRGHGQNRTVAALRKAGVYKAKS